MWKTNAGLTDRHTFDSRPSSWPRLSRGINFWVKDHRQIYLIGNPVVWWSSTAAIVVYGIVRSFLILRAKRGYQDFNHSAVVKYDQLCGFLALGWSLHYFPFYLMQRQLFLHHYFPALYFAILLYCGIFDLLTSTLRPRIRFQIATVLIVLAIWSFTHFSPLAYGSPWTKASCISSKWVKTWDFACNEFLDDYSQYKGSVAPTPTKSFVSVSTVDAPGRAPIVVEDPGQAKNDENDLKQTTLIIDKVQPGRDIFADEKVKNIESKQPVEPIHPEEPKEISSFFQTKIPGMPLEKQPEHVLLPDENAKTTPSSNAPVAATSSSSTSASPSISMASSSTSSASLSTDEQSSASSTGLAATSSIVTQPEVAKQLGPFDHANAEEERVRQELYPGAAAGRG